MNIETEENERESKNFNVLILIAFIAGLLLITATYAWFSSTLNAKVKMVNLVVSNDNGLSISFDGINFSQSIEISKEALIDNLRGVYPNHTNQWPVLGLKPVSTIGIKSPNDEKFEIYKTSGIMYRDKAKRMGYLSTEKVVEDETGVRNSFIAFDIFLRNKTGSPVSDNLYLDQGTGIKIESGHTEEMEGLVNSTRIAFLKIGSVPLESSVFQRQNVGCNGRCETVIYEPFSTNHTNMAIEKLKRYNINLFNGQYYPTYAMTHEVEEVELKNIVNNPNNPNFALQENRVDFSRPIFQIPDGITKVRVYIWVEGQDVDSFETYSTGSDISITLNFIKDTAGFDYYNE